MSTTVFPVLRHVSCRSFKMALPVLQLGVFRQRARDGHALLFATGKLRREVVHAVRQAHLRKHFGRVKRVRADLACQLNVLKRREVLHQVVELEHEADVQAAVLRQLLLVERADFAPVKHDRARGARVHAAQHVQQRGFASARRPYHHHELAAFARKRHAVGGGHLDLAHLVDLAHIIEFYERHGTHPFIRQLCV